MIVYYQAQEWGLQEKNGPFMQIVLWFSNAIQAHRDRSMDPAFLLTLQLSVQSQSY